MNKYGLLIGHHRGFDKGLAIFRLHYSQFSWLSSLAQNSVFIIGTLYSPVTDILCTSTCGEGNRCHLTPSVSLKSKETQPVIHPSPSCRGDPCSILQRRKSVSFQPTKISRLDYHETGPRGKNATLRFNKSREASKPPQIPSCSLMYLS